MIVARLGSPARRGLRTAAAIGLLLLAIAVCPSAGRADTTYVSTVDTLRTTIANELHSYMGLGTPAGPRTYTAGSFTASGGPQCWYCYDSAAVGAAVLSQQVPADSSLESVAVNTFDAAIADHQLANGAFADDDGTADGITTGFFTVDLGMAYLELRAALPAATQTLWSNSIAAAAQYLINSGNTTWYANGNIVLRQTEVLWLAYAATGNTAFRTAYDNEYAFAIAPSQSRWPGFGLQISRTPTSGDGADGAGYLAESGGGAPGFDPNYTMAQLDTASDLYVLTRDPKYLRLMNLFYNQLSPLVTSGWVLNATGGTRKDFDEPFMTPAVSVLAGSGDRPDITDAMVQGQLAEVESQYQAATTFTNVNFYKGFEAWLSLPLLNLQWPGGMAPDTRVASAAAPAASTPTVAAPTVTVTVKPAPVRTGAPALTTIGVTVSGTPRGSSTTVAVVKPSPTPPAKQSATRPTTRRRRRRSVPRVVARASHARRLRHRLELTIRMRRDRLHADLRHGGLVVEVLTRVGGRVTTVDVALPRVGG